MGLNRREPPRTIDFVLKRGVDFVPDPILWYAGGVLVDFTGATARMPLLGRGGDFLGLSTTVSSLYGGIVLGTLVLGTVGQIAITITKAATQALHEQHAVRTPFCFYVDWLNGTTWCLFDGTLFLEPGSPF